MSTIYRSADARLLVEERYRRFLDSWEVASTEAIIPTRQGDTFVLTCGQADAPPLVLLHGAGFNSASWTTDVATWARTHRLYAIDVIGEPGLSAPSRPPLNTDAYAEWLDDVLSGLEITRAAFVGASLGGWIALDYAVRRPERVTRLALLVPGGIGRQKYGAIIGSLFLMPFGRRGRRAAVQFVLGPRPAISSGPEGNTLSALDDYLLLIQRSYTPRRDRLPIFTDDQLRSLDLPVLVIAGEKDRLLDSQGTARRVADLITGAVVALIPGAGHIPVDYTETIASFLDDAKGRLRSHGPSPDDGTQELRSLLRTDLVSAMKARQSEVVTALRTALAAIDNAEAVTLPDNPAEAASQHVAGARVGVGSADATRRTLSLPEVHALLQTQIDERTAEAARYDALAQHGAAQQLRREAKALSKYAAGAAEGRRF